jgi:hypothetical protein
MAESFDSRWTWTVAGRGVVAAPPSIPGSTTETDPSLQHVSLDPVPTTAVISFDGSNRRAWLTAGFIAIALVVLFALPSRRREEDDDEDVFGDEAPGQSEQPASEPDASDPVLIAAVPLEDPAPPVSSDGSVPSVEDVDEVDEVTGEARTEVIDDE